MYLSPINYQPQVKVNNNVNFYGLKEKVATKGAGEVTKKVAIPTTVAVTLFFYNLFHKKEDRINRKEVKFLLKNYDRIMIKSGYFDHVVKSVVDKSKMTEAQKTEFENNIDEIKDKLLFGDYTP